VLEEKNRPLPEGALSKIVTHDDFDGVVCAALCSLAQGIDTFLFAGPGSILDMNLGIGADTIVCDLPHHPAAGLWFDHHAGNLEDFRLKGGDPDAIRGAFSLEKSCARVVYTYYEGKTAFPGYLCDTVDEADTIDSFDYRSIEEWRQETPGRILADTLRIPFPNLRERKGYLRHLILRVRSASLREVLDDEDVQNKVRAYREAEDKNRIQIERLSSFLPEDSARELILLDSTGLKHAPLLMKSLAFLSFPEAKAVLEIKSLFRQRRKTNDLGFSMSLSPSMEIQSSQKDVGEIMRELNIGDGHRGAGAGRIHCASKAEMLKQKEKIIRTIFDLWSGQEAEGSPADDGRPE